MAMDREAKSFLAMSLLLILVGCVALTEASEYEHRSRASVRIHQERSSESEMFATVEAFGETHDLVLEKIELPAVRIQELILGPNGTLIAVNVTDDLEERQYFTDKDKGSLLYFNDINNLEGTVTDSVGLRYENEGHIASRIGENSGKFCGTDHAEFHQFDAKNILMDDSVPEDRVDPSYVVELSVLADSVLRYRFSTDSDLVSYLRVYFYLVNRRYRTVSGATINLMLTDIIFSSSAVVDTYFMDASSSSSAEIDASLYKFRDMFGYNYQQGTINPFDIAHLVTGRNFYLIENGVANYNVDGLGYLGTVCQVYSGKAWNTGVGEDDGFYTGVLTSAHEIAHNLGASHDGQGSATTCSWSDGYLMSYVANSYADFWFSSCSSNAMRNIYYQPSASCLSSYSNAYYTTYIENFPGYSYSLDYQCQFHSKRSYAYADTSIPSNVHCYRLQCRYQEYGYIYTADYGVSALEGTACYSGGQCFDGYCQ